MNVKPHQLLCGSILLILAGVLFASLVFYLFSKGVPFRSVAAVLATPSGTPLFHDGPTSSRSSKDSKASGAIAAQGASKLRLTQPRELAPIQVVLFFQSIFPVGPGPWAHSFVGPCWVPGPVGPILGNSFFWPCWARALLGPFICWALLGPGPCWGHSFGGPCWGHSFVGTRALLGPFK